MMACWIASSSISTNAATVILGTDNGRPAVYLSGTIDDRAALDFLSAFTALPYPKLLILDSSGGDIGQAVSIGRFVFQSGMDTKVWAECQSACMYILLAGKNRSARPDAKLAFHHPSSAGNDARRNYDRGLLAGYTITSHLALMGYETTLINRIINGEELWRLNESDREMLKIR